jgi:hypothetical protein
MLFCRGAELSDIHTIPIALCENSKSLRNVNRGKKIGDREVMNRLLRFL